VVFAFGVLAAGFMETLSWEVALYALLSLTVIRMLPVALSLLRTHLRGISVLFAGWFGPRGLASIVLGLIVVEEAPLLSRRGEIEVVVASTVLLSVLLHGSPPHRSLLRMPGGSRGCQLTRRRREKRPRCRPEWAPCRPAIRRRTRFDRDTRRCNGREASHEASVIRRLDHER
jgi:hypothetical protein